MNFYPINEMTTLLSVGAYPALPLGMKWPKTWKKISGSKKLKFLPVSMAEFIGSRKKKGKYKVHR